MREFEADPPIEREVGAALADRDQTLAVVEGCTGGLVATLITDGPGASEYLDRALVPYSYDSVQDLLAVRRETLDAEGVVSGAVTRELAQGVRDTADVTWGLATTGIAGPDGGTETNPVGTAFVAVAYAGAWGTETSGVRVEKYEIDGSRQEIRERVARLALGDLSSHLTADGAGLQPPE